MEFNFDREYLYELIQANTAYDRLELIDLDLLELLDLAGW